MLASMLGLALLLAGCAGSDGEGLRTSDARAVTTEEAQVLAVARFRNFDAGTRSIAFEVDERGEDLTFDGWFDYASSVGYGALARGDVPSSLLLWNTSVVGVQAPQEGEAPLPVPDVDALATAWQGGPLDPSSSRLDAVLAVIGSLGSDRPENPLLLQQAGALHLGEIVEDGRELTVFAGPPSDEALAPGATVDPEAVTTRYAVDAAGTLHRVDVRLSGSGRWTTIRFGNADGVSLGDPFADAAETAP